jgi:hypothetical protein
MDFVYIDYIDVVMIHEAAYTYGLAKKASAEHVPRRYKELVGTSK